MLGMGVAPMGSSPMGVGQPEDAPPPPTGHGGCRFINAATGDYEIDPVTGQYAQMPPVRQRVLIALLTIRGSNSANPALGIKRPRKMGDRFQAEMEQAVRESLRQLTEVENVMAIDFILVERGAGGRARVTVSYEDLTTGERDQATANI
jgi:hypothetical protein